MTDFHEPLSPAEPEAVGGSDRAFGLVLATAAILVALEPLRRGAPLREWALVLAAAFAVPAIFVPRLLRYPNRAWSALGALLQRVATPIVLGAVFYLVVTPIGLVLRLRRAGSFSKGFDPHRTSYWIPREPDSGTMRDPF